MRIKTLIIFIICTLLICGAGLIGFQMAKNEPRIVQEDAQDEALQVGAEKGRITPDTTVSIDIEYKMCTHHIYESCLADEDLQGLTFSEFSEQYPNTKIIEFSSSKLVLKKTFRCYCPEHFVLKKDGDQLAVFRTKSGTDEQVVYREIDVYFNQIDEQEKQVLLTGKVFGTVDEIEIYLVKIQNRD